MAKINLNIEADTVEELQTILGTLQSTQSTQAVVDAITKTLKSEAGEVGTPAKTAEKTVSEPEKKPKAKAKAKEKVSTDSTADTAPSKTGKLEPTESAPVKEEPEEKSATPGKYPDATKADVQEAMKTAIAAGRRDAIKTAFQRSNAEKLSDLKPEDYSVFLSDLEILAGE